MWELELILEPIAKEKREQEKAAVLSQRMQLFTERGLEGSGLGPHRHPQALFKASQKLYSSQNLLKVWEHAHHEIQSRTFSPVCLCKAKSAVRDDHTDSIDKATIKSVTQSEGW